MRFPIQIVALQFTRVAACTLALSPIRDTLIEGFSHFVTSMTAPIASGWSGSPGGACTHWKAPPLHGARHKRSLGVCGDRLIGLPIPHGEAVSSAVRERRGVSLAMASHQGRNSHLTSAIALAVNAVCLTRSFTFKQIKGVAEDTVTTWPLPTFQPEWHSGWASPEAAVRSSRRISQGIVRPCANIEKATTANADTMI